MSGSVLGLDFGTGSVRAIIVDLQTGLELSRAESTYPTLTCASEPDLARQRPRDYIAAMSDVIIKALDDAEAAEGSFTRGQVLGIGLDATGSTPLPVDQHNQALGSLPEFRDNLNAQAWLWKDHTSSAEAKKLTELAAKSDKGYLSYCGGTYSSEWFWSKIWHCQQVDPDVFQAAYSWVECCDWLVSQLAGIDAPERIYRGACAAGHKALFSERWCGLPDEDFLSNAAPELADLRSRLFDRVYPIGTVAGRLCTEWSERTGLPAGIALSVANLDAHSGAVGAGVSGATLVKIMGTSTCDCALLPSDVDNAIPGISGLAMDSIIPGYFGIEAGQSAVGDIFAWFTEKICQGDSSLHVELSDEMASLKPGESGLIALDWLNGNRCILGDPDLSGHLFGLNLHTTRAEIYRAWIEATAFGAKVILEQLRDAGVLADTIVCCGGLPAKNPALMQIYADITECTLQVTASDETCALGAAIAAAVAADAFPDIPQAQKSIASSVDREFKPRPEAVAIYRRLFGIYRELHDSFGCGAEANLKQCMEDLARICKEQRTQSAITMRQ